MKCEVYSEWGPIDEEGMWQWHKGKKTEWRHRPGDSKWSDIAWYGTY